MDKIDTLFDKAGVCTFFLNEICLYVAHSQIEVI